MEAVTNQVAKLGFYSNAVHNPLQVELANKIEALSGCKNYELFLCNSGAEANENALKLASFKTDKSRVIAFKNGFHGRTSAAVAATDNKNIIAPNSLSMMEGVIQVDNLKVRDIMIPRSHIRSVFHDDSYHTILRSVLEAGHSRYPVLDKNLDDVEGVLLAKDLLKYVGREEEFDIDDILRHAIVVPEGQKLIVF